MQALQTQNEVKLTIQDVMMDTGIKARATVDKYIHNGVLKPIRKPGRQLSTRGRRMYFRPEAVEKLKKYMMRHGRIQPIGMPEVKRVKETRTRKEMTATEVLQVSSSATAAMNKVQVLAQLDKAIEQVQHLSNVIKMLSQSMRESDTNH
jgi:hypothetical protein